MSLLHDRRGHHGAVAGVHALIVGVGAYPHLRDGTSPVGDPWDMGQLTSTASSAYKVYEWLLKADSEGRLLAPLATCRVLLSPSPAEARLAGVGSAASVQNLAKEATAWRDDCKTSRDNVAFLYFAGHGVQRTTEDAVLCLEEFREPGFGTLFHSVSLANIVGGMAPAPGFEDIARSQFYFVDACRVRPDKFSEFERMGTTDVFDVALAAKDDRCSPIFYAAISNQPALADASSQTLFSRAILDCLDGEAGDSLGEDSNTGLAQWGITVNSLNEQLSSYKIDQLNREFQAQQTYAPGGQFRPGTICRLAAAPTVHFEVEMTPAAASQSCRLVLSQTNGPVYQVSPPMNPHPHQVDLPAGIYHLEITFDSADPTYRQVKKFCDLKPVNFRQGVRVA